MMSESEHRFYLDAWVHGHKSGLPFNVRRRGLWDYRCEMQLPL